MITAIGLDACHFNPASRDRLPDWEKIMQHIKKLSL
jgi:hypothetical protein